MPANLLPRVAFPCAWLIAAAVAVAEDPAPRPETPKGANPSPTLADVAAERETVKSRIKALEAPDSKENIGAKPLREALEARLRLLGEWEVATRKRAEAEHPARTPESEAVECRVDLEKCRALLERALKEPDVLLPDSFRNLASEKAIPTEAKLGELKEAIDAARAEYKDRAAELESLRGAATKTLAAEVAAARLERDKVHQDIAALGTRREERSAALNSASTSEARELARERLSNFEWEARIDAERLAGLEARIGLDERLIELATLKTQAKAVHAQVSRKTLDRMELAYAALSDRKRNELAIDQVREQAKARDLVDPLAKFRAKRTAELLELEEQVVAYEKASATTNGQSIQDFTARADSAVEAFVGLKKLISDGEVSPLDVLRLKNEYRRVSPERDEVARTDLSATEAQLITYSNALADAEIDLVNDRRDDRLDREALLEVIPAPRRGEASSLLDELETRHRILLNRRRNILQKLATGAEEAHRQVVRRLATLDEEYAFIRTHIFWVRDAEPLGATTLAHARDDSVRTGRALAKLAGETCERALWSRPTPAFAVGVVGLVILPAPLLLGRRALRRMLPPASLTPSGPEPSETAEA
jgi:potassium efflux system protein